ncbi:DinB family protein [Cryobacterium glaciale]|uniref:DinB family protein n=1 Tax=Cryobacterium glaciale TaxID=1259145 RepID=UPI001F53FE2D
MRRPLVPTGTNLLGLIKHVASVEAGYLGDTFERLFGEALPWLDEDAEINADMWATPGQSRDWVVDLYRRVGEHSAATVEAPPLSAPPLSAPGRVAWWPPERSNVTLHQILVHIIAETHRHAGHAGIVSELIDGSVGLRADNGNLPTGDPAWWQTYRERLETAAREADS